MADFSHLPIYPVLDRLTQAIKNHGRAVLQAPPGAGKTTAAPLHLLSSGNFSAKILMLEPRRMAAKNVAIHMASLLGESVGNTVGYRVRQETRVSPKTRIEVVTGGVLNRMLLSDPALENYSLVIFDEFHERNLDADLALALINEGASILREENTPLNILVMSATLDAEPVAQFLGENTPLITSEGRSYPVEVFYQGSVQRKELLQHCERCIVKALEQHKGDLLVFLPGQREILKLQRQLEERFQHSSHSDILIAPLFGALAFDKQQKAIEPLDKHGPWQRKIVLSTDIAETSLTIEGITVVIDCGLRREPVFDPKVGMTRLTTAKISRASAEQRAGRAGRLSPGSAYRLWAREEILTAFHKPDIENADLAPLVLQLLAWGAHSPTELNWLTPPAQSAVEQAIALLSSLGAVQDSASGHQLTEHGILMAQFPAHPRLAHMMIKGYNLGLGEQAAYLAALLSETSNIDIKQSPDIEQWLAKAAQRAPHSLTQQAQQYLKTLRESVLVSAPTKVNSPAALLTALAYPDRVGQKRSGAEEYLLANGRAARVPKGFHGEARYLAVAELGGQRGQNSDQIYSAAVLSHNDISQFLDQSIKLKTFMEWNLEQDRFIAEEHRCLGAITLAVKPLNSLSADAKVQSLCQLIKDEGLKLLTWSDESRQWLARMEFCRKHANDKSEWPDTSESSLLKQLEHWLAPYLTNIARPSELKKLDLLPALRNLLDWPSQQNLEALAPSLWPLPSGREAAIDYLQSPPVLAGKLQEFFGLTKTPKLANNQVALTLHLLSPAGRPLQVTQNLESFWQNGYREVKKEMKGRYPKHPWPDDPLSAPPTRKTKKHL